MRIIGIDPGTAIVGYGILDYNKNKFSLVDYGCIFTEKEARMEDRISIIYKELDEIIKKYKPDEMAVEELFFFKNNKTVISVGQARGVILLCGVHNKLRISEYTPLQVKMGITGYGRAEKKQIQHMVQRILNLEEIPKPDDAADAIAIGITHANTISSGINFNSASNKASIKITTDKISYKDYREMLKK